jgi:hypothetical protein
MSDIFVGDNDHGDAVPPTDVLLQTIKLLREDVVHFANELNEVTIQRDYARREVCWLLSERSTDPISAQSFAVDRDWDCFNSVTESYEKIATKYHATLEKLAQEESTNEN